MPLGSDLVPLGAGGRGRRCRVVERLWGGMWDDVMSILGQADVMKGGDKICLLFAALPVFAEIVNMRDLERGGCTQIPTSSMLTTHLLPLPIVAMHSSEPYVLTHRCWYPSMPITPLLVSLKRTP